QQAKRRRSRIGAGYFHAPSDEAIRHPLAREIDTAAFQDNAVVDLTVSDLNAVRDAGIRTDESIHQFAVRPNGHRTANRTTDQLRPRSDLDTTGEFTLRV